MKARTLLAGALVAGAMLVAAQGVASANVVWCVFDPPIQVVTPGGHNLTVNSQVYLPPGAVHMKDQIVDDATVQADPNGGTLITVYVHVPVSAHVVASENRFQVGDQRDGDQLLILYLHVPIS